LAKELGLGVSGLLEHHNIKKVSISMGVKVADSIKGLGKVKILRVIYLKAMGRDVFKCGN